MREIQADIVAKSKQAQALLDGENKDVAKAAALMDEVDALQKEFETLERVEKSKKAGVPTESAPAKAEADAVKAFAAAARAHFKSMNEGTGENGGYTVPEDISTKVNELRQNHFSLASLIDHETVSTLSGRRTFKTRSQATGFSQVGEGGKIGKAGAPKFSVLEYNIKKYAGYMPVTNELLEDSDAAIVNTMTEWLAEEGVATENAQILAKFNEKEAVALSGIADIKKVINVTLSMFAGFVRIITNADGLNYLDTLEDANGRPLLSPDPLKPMEASLNVGVRRIPVTIVPNEVWPSDGVKIPVIMGDPVAYLKQFDRKGLTLTTSNTAAVTDFNAFEQDMTLVRAIMRADWQVKDDAAIVRGELTPVED
jgi:HK97 family phage major capsid protein